MDKREKISRVVIGIILIAVIAIGALYLLMARDRYEKAASSEAIRLAQSMTALLYPEHIVELTGSPDDVDKPEYQRIKQSLARLVQTNHSIRFAYLLGQNDGEIFFFADSEPADSPDYSPPGQIFSEADDSFRKPFVTGETVVSVL